jgi:hypothetical protein
MSNDMTSFDYYADWKEGDYQAAQTGLYRRLGLRNEFEEDWAVINRDRDRVKEFADFYFGHPELRGCERGLCAELLVESAIDLIEPEPVDELEPAPDDVAEELMRLLLSDPYTTYHLLPYVRREIREAGYYRRISQLYDRIEPTKPEQK